MLHYPLLTWENIKKKIFKNSQITVILIYIMQHQYYEIFKNLNSKNKNNKNRNPLSKLDVDDIFYI